MSQINTMLNSQNFSSRARIEKLQRDNEILMGMLVILGANAAGTHHKSVLDEVRKDIEQICKQPDNAHWYDNNQLPYTILGVRLKGKGDQ